MHALVTYKYKKDLDENLPQLVVGSGKKLDQLANLYSVILR